MQLEGSAPTTISDSLVRVLAEHPLEDDFLSQTLAGLGAKQKYTCPVYFYDEIGSRIFYEITKVQDYYPTRTELDILARHADSICEHLDEGSLILELGGGGSRKIDYLLSSGQISAYVPMDVSKDHLISTANSIAFDYPEVQVSCIVGDYMLQDLPRNLLLESQRTVFFPGSTLGNLDLDTRAFLMSKVRKFVEEGNFLLGIDLVKDKAVLEAAYNDRDGLSARFNLNILSRINRELGGNFRLENFKHLAFYNEEKSRIEMHLESLVSQDVQIQGREFHFAKGETIHTENSHKFKLDEFIAVTEALGFEFVKAWTDDKIYFAEVLLKGK